MKYIKVILPIIFSFLISPLLSKSYEFKTPIVKKNRKALTSYNEMNDYLKKKDGKSRSLTLLFFGKSVKGRNLPLLFFSSNKKFGSQRGIKPVVFIFCQQHGNEPSGKEAALLLLSSFQGLLSSMNFL